MYIKSVVIDGFKSYANRTTISGWDPKFNAITGLNGSGKSNILDAICFVLGISNLTQVRAHTLQELVYKQGQSRVTKASVTVVFDNSDRAASPVGFEQYQELTVTRQVVIGGRNKYLINGQAAQLARVHNLFQSVQLNVNNPHFLIMQGRITKVCNMKPPEILSMIEEAAGTRMYENKKLAALKTIAKKQAKVEEVDKLVKEELTPTLEKLEKERGAYMQWSANNTEIERLTRFCIAFAFIRSEDVMTNSKDIVKEHEDRLQALLQTEKDSKAEIKQLESEAAEIAEQREQEFAATLKQLEGQVAEQSKAMVKETAAWQHLKESLETEEKNKKEVQKNVKEATAAIKQKESQIEKHAQEIAHTQEEHKTLLDHIAALEGQQLGFGTGDDKKDKGSVAAQLMEAQRVLSETESEAKSRDIKMKHLAQTLKQKEKAAAADLKEYTAMKKKVDEKEAALASMEVELKKMNFHAGDKTECESKIAAVKDSITQLQEEINTLSASLSNLNFQYSPPTSGFDRDKVKGMVAKLFEIKDPETAVALEYAAGGKLFQVVVDTQDTGKLLLEKGKLSRRVTLIPLNKISSKALNPELMKKVADVAGDKARLALDLVDYDAELKQAMQYVFGNTFVCDDAATAREVAFDKNIRTRTVDLAGTVYDPAGLMTGGSQADKSSLLLRLDRLNKLQSELEQQQSSLVTLQKQLSTIASNEAKAQQFITQRELFSHELSLLKTRLGQCAYAQLQQEVQALQSEIEAETAAGSKIEETRKAAGKHAKELEMQIKDFETERKNKVKEIEKELATCKKKVSSSSQIVKKQQQEHEKLQLELTALREELTNLNEQLKKIEELLATMAQEITRQDSVVSDRKSAYDKSAAELDKEKEKMAVADKKLAQLSKRKAALVKALSETSLETKKLQHKIQSCQAEEKDAAKQVEAMLKEHEWLAGERHLFGKPKSDYDFDATDPKTAEAKLKKLKEDQEKLSRKINKKVMGTFEKAKQEYQELMRKREIIEKDKAKIEEVIVELDRKKNEALKTTWQKVTKDFGSIFSTLLPGTMAKLEPPSGKGVLDGLEIRVAFNNVWKESLTEMSGGQRSLLALSLILALLLFKPAPMYILDEIDAALDLSHTQNIGTMLKTHFPQSQFIVVSLKEGMFNNANVVFRTKFVDGVSTVSRTQLRLSDKGQHVQSNEVVMTQEKTGKGPGGVKGKKRVEQDKENVAE